VKLNILYFAATRDTVGMDGETRDFPAGVATVADVLAALEREGEQYRAAFAEPSCLRFALDQVFVGIDAPVRDGAELGIFPPVTGG
jgi:molybdopterin synthase sulfur carrier subunit